MKTTQKKVLIVEDNPYIGSKILEATKNIGSSLSPYLSESLQNAYFYLDKNTADILILDLSLPDGSGLDILKMLNANNSKTKVFVFTL